MKNIQKKLLLPLAILIGLIPLANPLNIFNDFYKKIKPSLVVPMHGEIRHLIGHKRVLAEKNIRAEIVKNGEIIEIKEEDSFLIKGYPWINNDLVNLLNTTFSPLILYIFILLY